MYGKGSLIYSWLKRCMERGGVPAPNAAKLGNTLEVTGPSLGATGTAALAAACMLCGRRACGAMIFEFGVDLIGCMASRIKV